MTQGIRNTILWSDDTDPQTKPCGYGDQMFNIATNQRWTKPRECLWRRSACSQVCVWRELVKLFTTLIKRGNTKKLLKTKDEDLELSHMITVTKIKFCGVFLVSASVLFLCGCMLGSWTVWQNMEMMGVKNAFTMPSQMHLLCAHCSQMWSSA